MSSKKRIDLLLVEKGFAGSRQRARALIMAGKVLVGTLRIDKPGTRIDVASVISIKGAELPYVSRGGIKLQNALKETGVSVDKSICMDVGASTGGFTDCLLQHGAEKVYAVDVGYGQLAWKLRQNKRVIVIERTNIRHMARDKVPEPIEIVTIDTSFISLKIVVPAVLKFMTPTGKILALIKPQFEAGKGNIGKGGVIRSPEMRRNIICELYNFFQSQNLVCGPVVHSPIQGPKGNFESVILLHRRDSVL